MSSLVFENLCEISIIYELIKLFPFQCEAKSYLVFQEKMRPIAPHHIIQSTIRLITCIAVAHSIQIQYMKL